MRFIRECKGGLSATAALDKIMDFSRAGEWDTTVVKSVVRADTLVKNASGESVIGVGTHWDVQVDFLGSLIDIDYELMSRDETKLVLKGVSEKSVTTDELTVVPDGEGCHLTYNAEIKINFPYWLFDPILKMKFSPTVEAAMVGIKNYIALPK